VRLQALHRAVLHCLLFDFAYKGVKSAWGATKQA
jgi:hypothetical protein